MHALRLSLCTPAGVGEFSFLRTESLQRFAQLVLKNLERHEAVPSLLQALRELSPTGAALVHARAVLAGMAPQY